VLPGQRDVVLFVAAQAIAIVNVCVIVMFLHPSGCAALGPGLGGAKRHAGLRVCLGVL
jgi:hypothetical protein